MNDTKKTLLHVLSVLKDGIRTFFYGLAHLLAYCIFTVKSYVEKQNAIAREETKRANQNALLQNAQQQVPLIAEMFYGALSACCDTIKARLPKHARQCLATPPVVIQGTVPIYRLGFYFDDRHLPAPVVEGLLSGELKRECYERGLSPLLIRVTCGETLQARVQIRWAPQPAAARSDYHV